MSKENICAGTRNEEVKELQTTNFGGLFWVMRDWDEKRFILLVITGILSMYDPARLSLIFFSLKRDRVRSSFRQKRAATAVV